jgi:hypothetical protein
VEQEWRITIECVCEIFQKGALVALDQQSFLGHPALVFQCTLNQRNDPTLGDVSPYSLDLSPKASKRGQSPPIMLLWREIFCRGKSASQSINVVPEEELGCGVDGKPSGQVFKVNELVGFEIGDAVESPC